MPSRLLANMLPTWDTHWQALMHILWYIKATLHYKIKYGGDCFKDLRPTGWVDADYGGDIDS